MMRSIKKTNHFLDCFFRLEVVSDDGALIAAIDAALAKQPDVLDAIREGRMQAAGAVIGAVMQAMKGSADAGRVRELLIQKANA